MRHKHDYAKHAYAWKHRHRHHHRGDPYVYADSLWFVNLVKYVPDTLIVMTITGTGILVQSNAT